MRSKYVSIIRQAILYARATAESFHARENIEAYQMHREFEQWWSTLKPEDKKLADRAWQHEYLGHLARSVSRITEKLEAVQKKFGNG